MQSSEPTRYRWSVAGVLLLVTTHAFATRFSMSVVAQQLQVNAGLSNLQVGSLLSAFLMGYALMQFPVGLLVDRIGAFRVLVVSVFGWALFTMASAGVAWLPSDRLAEGLFITRLLTGASQAGVLTCTIKLLGRWMPAMQRSSANGLSMMGLGLGGALSPPLVVWIVAAGGWPAPFWAFGISGALIAVILWRTASEWPEQHSSVNPAELALIRGSATPPQGAPPPAPWRKFAASPSVWALSLSYGVAAYTSYVFFTWFYLYLVNVRGMSRTAGGYWAGLPYVAVAMGTLLGGRLADRAARHFGKRAGLLSIALCGECLAAILILVGGRVPNITLGVVLLACATGLHLFGQTSSWAATVDLAPAHAGLLFGVMNTLAQIAGTIAPVATPAIAARFGWGAALDFSAAMVALAGLLWILVRPERPIA